MAVETRCLTAKGNDEEELKLEQCQDDELLIRLTWPDMVSSLVTLLTT
jgi:hypothetical protein